MTDRHTADTINSDALDQLYDSFDGAYRERAHLVALLAAMTEDAVIAPAPDVDEPGWQIVYLKLGGWQASWHIAPRDAGLFTRVEHVDAADPRAQWDGHTTDQKYTRIRQHTRVLHMNRRLGPGREQQPAPGSAATQAIEPHTGLVVQPYRDHGEQKWVFRCWGTDTCDGWLSLDHYSEQSAERARDRHAAEEHGAPGPAATEEQDLVHALGGDRTAQTIAHTLTVHGHTLNAVRTMTYAELLAVPGIGGTSLARIRAALDGVPESDAAAATDPAGEYERTTGHAITCTAGFTDTCTCPPKEQH